MTSCSILLKNRNSNLNEKFSIFPVLRKSTLRKILLKKKKRNFYVNSKIFVWLKQILFEWTRLILRSIYWNSKQWKQTFSFKEILSSTVYQTNVAFILRYLFVQCKTVSFYYKLGTMTRAIARDLMPIGAAALLFDNEYTFQKRMTN